MNEDKMENKRIVIIIIIINTIIILFIIVNYSRMHVIAFLLLTIHTRRKLIIIIINNYYCYNNRYCSASLVSKIFISSYENNESDTIWLISPCKSFATIFNVFIYERTLR